MTEPAIDLDAGAMEKARKAFYASTLAEPFQDAIRAYLAALPATGAGEPCDIDDLWCNLCEKDDRTSPEEYPDHALITKDELATYCREYANATPSTGVMPADDIVEQTAQRLSAGKDVYRQDIWLLIEHARKAATGAGEWSVGDYVEVRWPDSLWQGYIVGFYTRKNGVQGANIEDANGNVHNYRLSHLKASPQSRI